MSPEQRIDKAVEILRALEFAAARMPRAANISQVQTDALILARVQNLVAIYSAGGIAEAVDGLAGNL